MTRFKQKCQAPEQLQTRKQKAPTRRVGRQVGTVKSSLFHNLHPDRPVIASLTRHNRMALARSREADEEDEAFFLFTKYRPVTPSTSDEVARYMIVRAPRSGLLAKRLDKRTSLPANPRLL